MLHEKLSKMKRKLSILSCLAGTCVNPKPRLYGLKPKKFLFNNKDVLLHQFC